MKKIKRLTAMIMAAAMLFILAANVSAADSIVCNSYGLDSDVSYYNKSTGKLESVENITGIIYIRPTIEKQQNWYGAYEYSISAADVLFMLTVPSSNFFDGLHIDVSNVSAEFTISIRYNVPYGGIGFYNYTIRQDLGEMTFKSVAAGKYRYRSPLTHFSIPNMYSYDNYYISTESITATVSLYPNEGSSVEIHQLLLYVLPLFPEDDIPMSRIISENT